MARIEDSSRNLNIFRNNTLSIWYLLCEIANCIVVGICEEMSEIIYITCILLQVIHQSRSISFHLIPCHKTFKQSVSQ
jgi:hypothetical protein